jgi:hypothetical protein
MNKHTCGYETKDDMLDPDNCEVCADIYGCNYEPDYTPYLTTYFYGENI